ncbi:hypothetical protein [Hymenobacter baengnokdamensis]|uniref:hypothetical protein n=1 Tax=Hymenobacter baengnokdamensis TaxID=2615203 RepID=UPI001246CB50|nr:hypothetical protein [Hymenobacter baengnokdamensis]
MTTRISVHEQVIALLVIINTLLENGDRINSYQFCRQLSRVFNLINCVEIRESLVAMGYVTTELSGAFHLYQITDLGRKLIEDNQVTVLQTLMKNAYTQSDFQQEMIKYY